MTLCCRITKDVVTWEAESNHDQWSVSLNGMSMHVTVKLWNQLFHEITIVKLCNHCLGLGFGLGLGLTLTLTMNRICISFVKRKKFQNVAFAFFAVRLNWTIKAGLILLSRASRVRERHTLRTRQSAVKQALTVVVIPVLIVRSASI